MKHYILLCRPRFEVAMIEIDDSDDVRARRMALEQAPSDPTGWALVPFDDRNYQPHIERCLSETEVEMAVDDGESEEDALAEVRALEQDEGTRYLLLKADTFNGEGEVHRQPWMSELPPMLEHDLCGDWLEAFETERIRALEEAKAGSTGAPPAPGQVVQFPKRDDEHDDDNER